MMVRPTRGPHWPEFRDRISNENDASNHVEQNQRVTAPRVISAAAVWLVCDVRQINVTDLGSELHSTSMQHVTEQKGNL